MTKESTNYAEIIKKSRETLSDKIDRLYAIDSIIRDFEWNYVKDCEYDSDGNVIRDENGAIIYNKTDCFKNQLIDEVIEYLIKKYS